MILPIYGYGHPVLRKKTIEIDKDYPDLDQLITNMYETMYQAHGIGLAAPQVGLNIRLFIIDATPLAEDEEYLDIKDELAICKKVFINFDENWNKKTENFSDVRARIIQHEYDHIEGILFTDLLSPLKKKLIKGKLANISKGKVDTEYRMKFSTH